MAQEENSWVFESLVGLLRGPVWNVPILTFIEHKSLIFEPDCDDCEEYQQCHEDYKNLVDFMLGSYMEDLGITPEQFESACGKASESLASKFHHSLFEQIWAAEDYEIFKRMMIQKNIELQLQALELLQQRYGIFPESMTYGPDVSQDEEAVMDEVLKKSLEDHQSMLDGMDTETKEIEQSLVNTPDEKNRLKIDNEREKDLLDKAMKMTLHEGDGPLPEIRRRSSQVEQPAPTAPPEEIAKRQEYLRQQRDKLLELKKIEREKQLIQLEQNNPQKRPKSARAAKAVFDSEKASTSSIDPHTLAARRALAARLKAEVIGGQ